MQRFKLPLKVRTFLVVILLLSFTLACEEQSDVIVVPGPGTPGSPGYPGTTVPTNPTGPTNFSSYINNRVSLNFKATDLYVRKHGDEIVYNYQSFIEDEISILAGDAGAGWFDATQVAAQLNLSAYSTLTGNVKPSQVPNASSVFTSAQLTLMNTYFNNMYSATSSSTATTYYNSAVSALNSNTSLTSEQKIQVRAAYDVANRFAQNYFGGSYSYIVTDITTVAQRTASSSSCVDWKGAWRGAVVGGVAGAVTGAYVGATGGTVALPGFGTVTGGVAGGVFGFASGFIGGAVGSIATDVLFKCLGGSSTMATVDCSLLYHDLDMRLQCELDHAAYNYRWKLTPF